MDCERWRFGISAHLEHEPGRPARRVHASAVRGALVAVALVQLVLATPAVVLGRDTGAPIHVAREVGSCAVALAVGFLFVARRPVRAAGVLPLVVVLVGCLAATSTSPVAVPDCSTNRLTCSTSWDLPPSGS